MIDIASDNPTDTEVGFELGSDDSESENVGRSEELEEPVVVVTSRGCLRLAEEDRALLDPDQVERRG